MAQAQNNTVKTVFVVVIFERGCQDFVGVYTSEQSAKDAVASYIEAYGPTNMDILEETLHN